MTSGHAPNPGLPRWPAAPGSSMLPRHRPASRSGHVRHHRRGPPSRRARRAPRRSRSRTQPAGRRVPAREPAGVPRSGGPGTPSDRHSAPATAPVAPTVESGDTAGAATSSPRRSPSTSECPGTGDPGTPRAHASLVHRTAQTSEASRRIVSAQAGPSDSRSRLIKKRRTRRYARPVANQAPSHPRVPNGGYLRARPRAVVTRSDRGGRRSPWMPTTAVARRR